ncbi:MAG: GTP-binding protein [Sellimonas sp.]|nr:GTP-binding protein [Sellimonas sp.]
MKILVVSGFLGAGKTTFIKEMAQKTKQDFVVMENEYGEVGIDKTILDEEKDINIWELTEGCICCSMKSDFASSILTIANTLDPEYLIVEPTGVGVLSNVIHNIQQIEYERISLLSPVTIVDANCFDHYMRDYRDIFEDQLKAAGTIVISKRNFDTQEEMDALVSKIREVNPDARIQAEHYSRMELSWWNTLLHTDLSGNPIAPETMETPNLLSLGLTDISLPGPNHLIWFLEQLIHGAYGTICRAKGFVDAGGCLLRFDVVDDRYTITGFDEAEQPKSVFIGPKIKRRELRKILIKELRESS